MAIDCYMRSISRLTWAFKHDAHPFAVIRTDKLGCLPGPSISPLIARKLEDGTPSTPRRLKQFEFDPEQNLLYVGGYVKCLAWCPVRLHTGKLGPEEVKDIQYLAVATYPSPGSRVSYADVIQYSPGLVQIWHCGPLGHGKPPEEWAPRPHLFVAHEWGHVTDMCWLPLSVTCAARIPEAVLRTTEAAAWTAPPPPSSACRPEPLERPADEPLPYRPIEHKAPFSPLTHRTVGHLILACLDGFVRVLSVPRWLLDTLYFHGRRSLPIYQINPKVVLRLSPCETEHLDWVGWPTCVHMRPEYPSWLFVGYSRGHVAHYDLACVEQSHYSQTDVHLRPTRLTRVIKGPVRGLCLNPANGRMIAVQGIGPRIQLWDWQDVISLTTDTPELASSLTYGFCGSRVVWHPRGDTIYTSRQSCFNQNAVCTNRGKPVVQLSELIDRPDNAVCQWLLDDMINSTRILIPLGVQEITCLDFSDTLNALLCATDRGRIEAVVCSMDGRVHNASRDRYLSQLRLPVCQWEMHPIPQDMCIEEPAPEDLLDETTAAEIINGKDGGPLLPNVRILPPSHMPVTDGCEDCASDRLFCWHRLWTHSVLSSQTKESVIRKPQADFIQTPQLSVTQARFNPNPQAATWLASGTASGFVQFIQVEPFYLSEFDQLLGLEPTNTDSPLLAPFVMPSQKSIHHPINPWPPRPVAQPLEEPNNDRSMSGDSDVTEKMTCDLNGLQIHGDPRSQTRQRRVCLTKRKCPANRAAAVVATDSDETDDDDDDETDSVSTDQTEPCYS